MSLLTREGLDPTRTREQREVCELIKDDNVIVNAPTGWGKTLVIAESTRYFLSRYPTQRVCVIAPSVVIVQQHASNFHNLYGIPRALAIHGSPGDWKSKALEADEISIQRWRSYFDQNEVIVATPQLFLEGMAAMPLGKISMMAFDECHHATGSSPMSQILTDLQLRLGKEKFKKLRLVGLTATIFHGRLTKQEGREAQLSKSKQELAEKFNTTTFWVPPSSLNESNHDSLLIDTMATYALPSASLSFHQDGAGKRICTVKTTGSNIAAHWVSEENLQPNEPSREGCSNADPLVNLVQQCVDRFRNQLNLRVKPFYSRFRRYRRALQKTYEEIGLAGLLHHFCPDWRDALAEERNQFNWIRTITTTPTFFPMEDALPQQHQQVLDAVVKKFFASLVPLFRRLDNKILYSPQVNALIEILSTSPSTLQSCHQDIKMLLSSTNSTGNRVSLFQKQGIVFVAEKVMTSPISKILNFELARMRREAKLQRVDSIAEAVFGTSGTSSTDVNLTLDKFRKKQLTVLVATPVLEEGLDVPSVEWIVRLSESSSVKQLVQSSGRARGKEPKIFLFKDDNIEFTQSKAQIVQAASKPIDERSLTQPTPFLSLLHLENGVSIPYKTTEEGQRQLDTWNLLQKPSSDSSPVVEGGFLTLANCAKAFSEYCQVASEKMLSAGTKLPAKSFYSYRFYNGEDENSTRLQDMSILRQPENQRPKEITCLAVPYETSYLAIFRPDVMSFFRPHTKELLDGQLKDLQKLSLTERERRLFQFCACYHLLQKSVLQPTSLKPGPSVKTHLIHEHPTDFLKKNDPENLIHKEDNRPQLPLNRKSPVENRRGEKKEQTKISVHPPSPWDPSLSSTSRPFLSFPSLSPSTNSSPDNVLNTLRKITQTMVLSDERFENDRERHSPLSGSPHRRDDLDDVWSEIPVDYHPTYRAIADLVENLLKVNLVLELSVIGAHSTIKDQLRSVGSKYGKLKTVILSFKSKFVLVQNGVTGDQVMLKSVNRCARLGFN